MEYRGDLLSKLTQGNVTARLTGPERVDLIGNAVALADAGKLSGAETLALVETFHNDPERDVIDRALFAALSPVRRDLIPENLQSNYQRFLAKNFGAKATELGWLPKPSDSDEVKLLRPPILRVMATSGGDRELASQAHELALAWLNDRKAIATDVAASVLRAAAYNGDSALYQRFLDELRKTNDRQDQQSLLRALDDFRDPAALAIGFQAILSKSIPLQQGVQLIMAGVDENPRAKLPYFQFIKSHFDDLARDHPTIFGFDLGGVLPTVGGGFCDAQSRSDLDSFFAPLASKYDGMPRNLAQADERIDLCIAIKQAQAPGVAAFLAKY